MRDASGGDIFEQKKLGFDWSLFGALAKGQHEDGKSTLIGG